MYKVYQLNVGKETYIGCTSMPILNRMSCHRHRASTLSDVGYNYPVSKALRKAGLFEAVVTVLHQFSDKERAFKKEASLIKQLQPSLNVQLK